MCDVDVIVFGVVWFVELGVEVEGQFRGRACTCGGGGRG